VLFILYPLSAIVRRAFTSNGLLSARELLYVFNHARYLTAIKNSVLLGALVATLATFMGYIFAYSIVKARVLYAGFFRKIVLLPMISPPFMFALSVILLFGRNGLITARLLGLDIPGGIYGLKGLLIVQSIALFPIAYVTLAGILAGIHPDLETCAMNMGAGRARAFFSVTLPLSLPGVFASWLLVFVLSMTDFGNPIIIGGNYNVLSVQTYMEFTGMGNLTRGSLLAILLLVPTLFVFFAQRAILKKKSYVTVTGKTSRAYGNPVSSLARKILFLFCVLVIGFCLLLYVTIILGSFINVWGVDWTPTFKHIKYSIDVGWRTMMRTLFLAALATPITALLGMIIAALVMRRKFFGQRIMEIVSILSYAIPGTAVGIGYILAFNAAPFRWSGTAFILVMCYVFRNIPIGVESATAALRQISSDIEEASMNLGAGFGRSFRRITLPLLRPSLFAGASYSFIRSMTAISAIIFLVSARWNHITVLILAQTEILRLGVASALSTMLILVIMLFVGLITRVTGLRKGAIFNTVS